MLRNVEIRRADVPTMWDQFKAWIADEDGATLVEYALIIALIAVVAIVSLQLLGGAIRDRLGGATQSIQGPTTAP